MAKRTKQPDVTAVRPVTARRRTARRGSSQEQEGDTALIDFSQRKANRRGTNATSLANLRKGNTPLAVPTVPITPAIAELFVKLRTSGVPAPDAVRICLQGTQTARPTDKQVAGWVKQFEQHALVADAYRDFNGGAWQDLDDDTRTDVALRVHIAQCAHILYTSDLSDPLANMKKIEYARTVIVDKIALEKEAGSNDKFTQFMEELVKNASAGLPPTFKKENTVLPALPASFIATKGN